MATYDEEIIARYLLLDEAILEAIDRLLGSKSTQLEIIRFIASTEFDKMIYDLGLTDVLNQYEASLLRSSAGQIALLNQAINVTEKQNLLSTSEDILRQAKRFATQGMNDASIKLFQDTLLDQLSSGVSRDQILLQLKSMPLTTAQLQTNIHTAYSSINRSLTAIAFSDVPEQKFHYAGGVIPTSSEQCAWLFMNQRKTGYTKPEIDAGIQTPYGEINWQGRIPNFNCIHEWIPIQISEPVTNQDKKNAKDIL